MTALRNPVGLVKVQESDSSCTLEITGSNSGEVSPISSKSIHIANGWSITQSNKCPELTGVSVSTQV